MHDGSLSGTTRANKLNVTALSDAALTRIVLSVLEIQNLMSIPSCLSTGKQHGRSLLQTGTATSGTCDPTGTDGKPPELFKIKADFHITFIIMS